MIFYVNIVLLSVKMFHMHSNLTKTHEWYTVQLSGDLFVQRWSDRRTCYSGTMVTRLGPILFAGYLWMG